MNNGTKLLSLTLCSSLLLAGCGNDEEELTEADVEAAAQEAAQEAQAETEQSVQDRLSTGFADMQKSAQEELNRAKAEVESNVKAEVEQRLAEQKEQLVTQFEASNSALRKQVDALTAQYEQLKPKLPESVQQPFQEKLPELNATVNNLESLVNQFSPDSMAQIEDFKNRYQNELATAKQLYNELVKAMANTEFGKLLPKF